MNAVIIRNGVVAHGCAVNRPKDGVVAHGCAVNGPKDGKTAPKPSVSGNCCITDKPFDMPG